MDEEFAGDSLGVKTLGPPPREVPLKLRVQLLTNLGVVIGGLIFGVGSALGVAVLLAASPVFAWRVARNGREAPGWLASVEPTNYEENDEQVFRCRYTFRTPDGVEHPGTCYMVGENVAPPPPQAKTDPKLRPKVVVEYDPGHPEASRIKGMRVGSMAPIFTLFLLLPGLIGLLTTLGGLLLGRSRIHLLEDGELARATLISCQATQRSDGAPEIPFAEFRQTWLANDAPAKDKGVSDEPEFTAAGSPVAPPGMSPFAPSLARGFLTFWTCGVVVMLIVGTPIIVGGLILLLLDKNPPRVGGRPDAKTGMILFSLVVLVGWLLVGFVLLRAGRRMRAVLSGKVRPSQINPHPWIQCTFEYPLPGGEVVRAKDTVRFSSRLGDEPNEPVLYDPARPDRAILLHGLSPAVRVTPFGEWQAADGLAPWLRGALAVASFVAGPWIGWMAWHWS